MSTIELIEQLELLPPMAEVYIQTSATALNKVGKVRYDSRLGCVELFYEEKK